MWCCSQQVGPSSGGGSASGAGYADNKPAPPPAHGNGDALRTEDEMTASTGEYSYFVFKIL